MKKSLAIIGLLCSLIIISSFTVPTENDPEKKVRTYNIFGEKYKSVTILSEKLKGQVYYIVSGHGGPDPGAVTTVNGHTISEDEYAYDISLRLCRNLIAQGALVYMIVKDPDDGIRDEQYLKMDKDEFIHGNEAIPLNQGERLRQRTRVINNLYKENLKKGYLNQRVVEIHVDSRHQDKNIDIFFYHQKDNTESLNLATKMKETLIDKYNQHQKGRGYTGSVSSRGLWTLNNSIPPTVYIEVGNITNVKDQRRILIPNNRQAMANWLMLAILNHD